MVVKAYHEKGNQHEKVVHVHHVPDNAMSVNMADHWEDCFGEIEVMKSYHLSKIFTVTMVLIVEDNCYLPHHIEVDIVLTDAQIVVLTEIVKEIIFVLYVLLLLDDEVDYHVENAKLV